ncbi:MAG TPA: D-alanyl-D-alanine carboxypeptidase, partial [Flavisolibacter sp.]|nr:D-alanyl-D-alanine carboxypeptidase [Flavisolibacter sp.]
MKKLIFFLFLVSNFNALAQDISTRLKKAVDSFQGDDQLQQALFSLYVIDAADGTVIFDRNSLVGLAPASTQKIITSATAYEILGKDFRYQTLFLTDKNRGKGAMAVIGSGDPTLGSWRFSQTTDTSVFRRLRAALQNRNFIPDGPIRIPDTAFGRVHLPTGYIFEDIGNYYGSGHNQLNWNENQYDLNFASGSPGTPTTILSTKPALSGVQLINHVKAGSEGSGDNAYLYFVPGKNEIIAEGTVPPHKAFFTISGAVPDPAQTFSAELRKQLASLKSNTRSVPENINASDTLFTHYSPPLDSIVYWFL